MGNKVSALRDAHGKVKQLRAAATAAPQEPGSDLQSLVSSQTVRCLSNMYAPPLTESLRHVCTHRRSYSGVALFEGECEEGGAAFLFLYAQQSPMEAVFLKLFRVVRKTTEAFSAELALDRTSAHFFAWEFEYTPMEFVLGSRLPFDDWENVGVVDGCEFVDANMLASDSPGLSWTAWVRRCAKLGSSLIRTCLGCPPPPRPPETKKGYLEVHIMCPWVACCRGCQVSL